MSVISKYHFLQGFFNGLVLHTNQPSSDETFGGSLDNNVLTLRRPNAEHAIDLGAQINTDANIGRIAKQLIGAHASLTSDLRVQGVVWPSVPYFFKFPARHLPRDMLIKVSFDFDIDVPIWDIGATLSIYLFAFLDSKKHLQVRIDGTHLALTGLIGLEIAQKKIEAAMPQVLAQVDELLKPIVAGAGNIQFAHMYYMPGKGSRAIGAPPVNASHDLSVGLLVA